LLAELNTGLSNNSFISDERLTQLKPYVSHEKQAEYTRFTQHIFETDYAKAKEILAIFKIN